MQKFIVKGYINELKYDNIEFKDKKTGEDRIVKKCECVVTNIEDDQLLPITFWGLEKISNYFIDISEGSPVVASFSIKSREYKGKIYISLNGIHIEKYGGIPIEKKIEDIDAKRKYQSEQRDKELPQAKTFAEQEWEENLANYPNATASAVIDDLPF